MGIANSLKEFSFVGIGRIVTVTLQALFYLFFAALLDPSTYGELNLILALAGTFSIMSLFGLHLSLQVYRVKNITLISDQIITLFLISTVCIINLLIQIDRVRSSSIKILFLVDLFSKSKASKAIIVITPAILTTIFLKFIFNYFFL